MSAKIKMMNFNGTVNNGEFNMNSNKNMTNNSKNWICCAKGNTNTVTVGEGESERGCLQKLKETHFCLKIIYVLITLIVLVSPFIPKIIDAINVSLRKLPRELVWIFTSK